jgi:hypothetical protein
MAKEHEMATSVVDQANEDQTHSSMMAWRVHEGLPEKHTVEMQTV